MTKALLGAAAVALLALPVHALAANHSHDAARQGEAVQEMLDANGVVDTDAYYEYQLKSLDELWDVLDVYASTPGEEAYLSFTIHWTNASIDWCMWLVLDTVTWVVYDGNINGTICCSGNWIIDSVTPQGGRCYQLLAHQTACAGSCADDICMDGCKDSPGFINDATYGWWGSCTDFIADGAINACEYGVTTLHSYDDISGVVGSQYSGVTYSAGWQTWDSRGNTYYDPFSDPNVIYTHEATNSVVWEHKINNLDFYASTYGEGGDTFYYTVYDKDDVQLAQTTLGHGNNQLVTFSATGIKKMVVTGTGSWTTHHTIDHLSWVK